jgi:hypothetical protein
MTPYSPQQNGVVEHRNSTVVGVARSMLKARGRGCPIASGGGCYGGSVCIEQSPYEEC